MTEFIRLESEADKECSLREVCRNLRNGITDVRHFDVPQASFAAIPGTPFSYWISAEVRDKFQTLPPFGSGERSAWVGLQTNDNFQWLRQWWEPTDTLSDLFALSHFVKGGAFSPFYTISN